MSSRENTSTVVIVLDTLHDLGYLVVSDYGQDENEMFYPWRANEVDGS
jgi:hypothetical protein